MRQIEGAPSLERLPVFHERLGELPAPLQKASEISVECPDLRSQGGQSLELLRGLIQHRQIEVDLTEVEGQRGVIRDPGESRQGKLDHLAGMPCLPLILLEPTEERESRGALQPLGPDLDGLTPLAKLLQSLPQAEITRNELGVISDHFLEEATRIAGPPFRDGDLPRLVTDPRKKGLLRHPRLRGRGSPE